MGKTFSLALMLLAGGLLAGGCVRRTLTVTSEPPGALVWLNDQEFGRTPVTREFTWYGHYDVELRREGFQTVKTEHWVVAPWWQWPPIDLVAELFPLTDRRTMHVALEPACTQPAEPARLIERAQELRPSPDALEK